MSLFDFLKKKKPEPVVLEEKDLAPFFEKAVNKRFNRINARIHEINLEIKYHRRQLASYLDQLEKEELANPDISPRERQIMEGNRKNYVRRFRSFVDSIAVPDSYLDIEEFCTGFFEQMEQVTADTQKNFFVLKEFFQHTVQKVSAKLQALEKLFIELKRLLEKENISMTKEIRSLFSELASTRKERAEMFQKKKDVESEIHVLEAELGKIHKKINHLKLSNDYRFYQQFLKEENALEEKENTLKNELLTLFVEIERGLKKYAKQGENKKRVAAYMNNPVEALLMDERLAIATLLNKVAKGVRQGRIELKPKKKEKVLATLGIMTKSWLKEKREQLLQIAADQAEVHEKLRKNASNLQLREQQGYKKNTEDNLAIKQREQEEIENRLESINPNLILQKIVKKLEELSSQPLRWKR